MHLKMRINFRTPAGPMSGPRVRLFELANLLLALLLLVAGPSGASTGKLENDAGLRLGKLYDDSLDQDGLTLKLQEQPVRERKCVPMLNLVLPQARPNVSHGAETNARELEVGEPKKFPSSSGSNLPGSFTFPINDIFVPLEPQTGRPVQSAMRLLSTFDSQLLGDDEDDDDNNQTADADGELPPRGNSIRFQHNKLHISDLNLTMLNVHLYGDSEPRFGLGVNIGNATLAGQFLYDGVAPLLTKLAGHYRMSIDNVLVTVGSNLTISNQTANFTVLPELPYRLVANDFKMNISNLGYISIDILDAKDSSRQTPSYMLKLLQRVLQMTIKRTYNKFEDYIRQTLETEGHQFVDCELTRFSSILRENQRNQTTDVLKSESEKANILDELARIVSSEIRNSRLDRVALPNFEYQRTVFGTSALIVFANGSLSGLDNLRLLGETKVKLQREHLIVNASLGWFSLKPQYNWTLYLGNAAASQLNQTQANGTPEVKKPMAKGLVGANIKTIEFDTLISRSLRQSQTRATVDELTIRRLEGPKMDIGGLPGMNRLTRATVNFFMARLKPRLVSSIQASLKSELERALNRLTTAKTSQTNMTQANAS